MSECIFFHAINTFYGGDYAKLKNTWANFSSWEAAWERVRKEAKLNPEIEWGKLAEAEINLALNSEAAFPELLRQIPAAPFGLYWRGTLPEKEPTVAIVGTRRATTNGKLIAKNFAENLARAGVTVVSGLAFGIDTAAHEGAVASGGKTIAVLAGGADFIYPQQNVKLAQKILDLGGAIVSEYPLGTPT
jgi:DNA processing protein